jgi:hypothetical protein
MINKCFIALQQTGSERNKIGVNPRSTAIERSDDREVE